MARQSRVLGLLPFVLAASLLPIVAAGVDAAEPTTRIAVDGRSPGRVFEGIGALSAGASSRLLIDYPEPYRSQILDLLFKPNYGAGFQHLKVEIGGDVNSTDGCEPSHMHRRDDGNYDRGYEWWLMKEGRQRNPGIVLDCLAWGAPGWIGGGKYFTQDCADYMAKFLLGARRVHGLNIGYIGILNEMTYDPGWIKTLRATLDRSNLRDVKIVAADEVKAWKLLDHMKADPELAKTFDVLGVHYVGVDNGVRKVDGHSPRAAIDCGKRYWASEDGPWRGDWTGAGMLARAYNLNYIHSRMTKTIIWSLITSYYDNLPLPGSGVMRANTPWTGHFEIQPALWATAHTTQFARPGWKYLDSACVELPGGGTCVALRSPDGDDYSIVIETIEVRAPQRIGFNISGGLSTRPLHVWRSDEREQFVRSGEINPTDGKFDITLDPGCIYSLTTTTGQTKAAPQSPPWSDFPDRYREDFETCAIGSTPRYFSDQAGIFEVVSREDGKGKALRQVIPGVGIEWAHHLNWFPETFLGGLAWENYTVSCDALIEKGGFVSLFGRVGKVPQKRGNRPPDGYWLAVRDGGCWTLAAGETGLECGFVKFPADTWHRLELKFAGNRIAAFVDGAKVTEVEDNTFRFGMAGVGCGWHGAQFENFAVDVEPHPRNLAARRPARASSELPATGPLWENDVSFDAWRATDAIPSLTRWSAVEGRGAGEWLEVDLGRDVTFNRTIVREFEQRIAGYKIQYWNGRDWTDACNGKEIGWPGKIDTFAPVKASKVRLLITAMKSPQPPSIYEFEVYDSR